MAERGPRLLFSSVPFFGPSSPTELCLLGRYPFSTADLSSLKPELGHFKDITTLLQLKEPENAGELS